MRKIQKETLETVLEEFQGYECLKDSIQELVDPEMGLISAQVINLMSLPVFGVIVLAALRAPF